MPSFDSYELHWPHQVYLDEITNLGLPKHGQLPSSGWYDQVEWLLIEAFGQEAANEFKAKRPKPDPWDQALEARELWKNGATADVTWLLALNEAAPRLPVVTGRRVYFSRRNSTAPPPPVDLYREFANLINRHFDEHGYLDEHFGANCVDDHRDPDEPGRVLEDHLGVAGLWPLDPEAWDQDTFCDLVEVFYDLVSRPAMRWWHDYGREWDYSDFHRGTGRALYRWRINQLLQRANFGYQLAGEGESHGQLVAISDEAREELLKRAVENAPTEAQKRIAHAIGLFRKRDATPEDKRSAIEAAYTQLEDRRFLLKNDLPTKKDEAALFLIANEFGIRHEKGKQSKDYDPAFLDWIFWWYLATIELTNQLISRQDAAASQR